MTANEKITSLGRALSKLPVGISIGKMLLMGCVFEQIQPVLTLAAAMSIQTPFTNRAYRDHECEVSIARVCLSINYSNLTSKLFKLNIFR